MRAENEAYRILEGMVQDGSLTIVSITSPPRTSSTALERLLTESPEIDGQCNEPWSNLNVTTVRQRNGQAYETLLVRVQALAAQKRGKLRIVVKNIADFIAPGDSFAQWDSLVSRHIMLVRNPVLSIESALNTIFKELDPQFEFSPGLSAEAFAKRHGFSSWPEFHTTQKKGRQYHLYQEPVLAYFKEAEPTLHDPQLAQAVQAAQGANYKEEEMPMRVLGWDAFGEHLRFLKKTGKPFAVIDSTLLRAFPEKTLSLLCPFLQITYTSRLTKEWDAQKSLRFDKGWQEHPSHFFYERALSSQGLEPPLEKPIPLDNFPPVIQRYLTKEGGALSVYQEALSDPALVIDRDADVTAIIETSIAEKPLTSIDPVFSAIIKEARSPRHGP